MDAIELLCRQIERQIDSLFRAARALPADKLDWKPTPNSRSALSQLQEVATAAEQFWAAHAERKVEWNADEFGRWLQDRQQYDTLDALERKTRETHAKVIEFIRNTKSEDLTLPVEMPFPGEFTLADIFSYYYWNASYHEGQITYIGALLEQESPAGVA